MENTNTSKVWASAEFEGACFGDKRLEKRVIDLAADLADIPGAPIPQASEDYAAMKAAYRFFDNPKVSPDKILSPHVNRTWQRCRQESTLLVVHDTSFLNFSNLSIPGLATLGHKKTVGLGLHSGMALTLEGLPLGVAYQNCYGSEGGGKVGYESEKEFESKSSYRWLDGVNACRKAGFCGKIIHIADREADIFELLTTFQDNEDYFVIRSHYDRYIDDDDHKRVGSLLESAAALGTIITNSKSLNEELELTCKVVKCSIKVPNNLKSRYKACFDCMVVEFKETSVPENRDPIQWRILTNIKTESLEDAKVILDYYKLRWRIEEYHKVLKSSCKLEELMLQTPERLKNAIALYSVVGWRIFWMNHMARVNPKADATEILTGIEISALRSLKRFSKQLKGKITVKKAVICLGKLGGFIPTRAYPMPGNITFWRGFVKFIGMTEMYEDLNG